MTHEEVQKKAYERFCWRKQNDMPGTPEGDWTWAQYELLEEQEEQPYHLGKKYE